MFSLENTLTTPRGASSEIQKAADKVVDWSKDQCMHLNEDKCKEIRIVFEKNKHSFDPVLINGKDLSVVKNAKILGVTISNDLKCPRRASYKKGQQETEFPRPTEKGWCWERKFN